jgi:hypothetical protein
MQSTPFVLCVFVTVTQWSLIFKHLSILTNVNKKIVLFSS